MAMMPILSLDMMPPMKTGLIFYDVQVLLLL